MKRTIESKADWQGADGVKIYTISAGGQTVDRAAFAARLQQVMIERALPWHDIPAFAIFHAGSCGLYLVLAWWANGNELFTSVSVLLEDGWTEDPRRYSFCLFDLEVFWAERNFFVETVYCPKPDFNAYRSRFFVQGPC